MRQLGLEPDPWQQKVCTSTVPQQLLLAHRQFGKSTCYAAIAAETACNKDDALVLLFSRTQRQAAELFRKVTRFYYAAQPIPLQRISAMSLELANHSRIISLPGKEETIVGYSAPDLVIIDEAARVGDNLYHAIRPMMAMSTGRLIAASTPWGRRGWFYETWEERVEAEAALDAAQVEALLAEVGITVAPDFAQAMVDAPPPQWERTKITAPENPRITPYFLANELRTVPRMIFRSEWLCQFTETTETVFRYDDLERMLSDDIAPLWSPDYQALPWMVEEAEPLVME